MARKKIEEVDVHEDQVVGDQVCFDCNGRGLRDADTLCATCEGSGRI